MSRGFTKEDDSLPAPVVPARAPLPPNTPNYVTPRGLTRLRAELVGLEAERAELSGVAAADAQARTQELLVLNGRISGLTSRLSSAKVVKPRADADEARFGATITLQPATGQAARRFTIVGVDEAEAVSGRIAFTAPVARTLLGKRVGDFVLLPGAKGPEPSTVTAIAYETGTE